MAAIICQKKKKNTNEGILSGTRQNCASSLSTHVCCLWHAPRKYGRGCACARSVAALFVCFFFAKVVSKCSTRRTNTPVHLEEFRRNLLSEKLQIGMGEGKGGQGSAFMIIIIITMIFVEEKLH